MDDDGRLVSDPYAVRQLGLRPGHALRIETGDPLWVARRPVTDLARVYVEPTNACTLACATCVRNVWSAQSGFMAEETFDAILRGLASFPRPPDIFFGGFGEPLAHPRILSMIEAARRAGSTVELITNGILLTDAVRRAIVSLGLHRLWVSVDGATPAAYRDVRIGDALPEILENLAALRRLREALADVLEGGPVDLRPRLSAVRGRNFCPLVERGTTSVRWDGTVSPCLALLYEHETWLGDRRRHSYASAVGNVRERGLAEIWSDPPYVELRQRLQAFGFSPCSSCNTCEMADDNRQDCTGSPHPACGGCLWAQGLIQCP